MTRIWNGSSTEPHTLPNACFCAGSNVGDFIELSCGHGGPTMEPMHIKCMISSFVPEDGEQPQPPRCPMCRGPVDQGALTQLVAYVRQGAVVPFPGEEDQEQTTRVYANLEEGLELVDTLARAQRLAEGGDAIQATQEEQQPGYWTDERNRISHDLQTVRFEFEAQEQTPEDLEHLQAELDTLKGHLIGLVGRATLFENREGVFRERNGSLSYDDVRGELSSLGRDLTKVSNHVLALKVVPALMDRVTAVNAAIEGGLTPDELNQKEADLAELGEEFHSLENVCGSSHDLYPDLLRQGLELLERTTKNLHVEKTLPGLLEQLTAIDATIEGGNLTLEGLEEKEEEFSDLRDDFESLEKMYGYSPDLYPERLTHGLELVDRTSNKLFTTKMPILNERITAIDTALEGDNLTLEELDQKEAELKNLTGRVDSLEWIFDDTHDLYPDLLKRGLELLDRTRNNLLAKKDLVLVRRVTDINTEIEGGHLTLEELDQKGAELADLQKSFTSLKSLLGHSPDLYSERLKQGLELLSHTTKAFLHSRNSKVIWNGSSTDPHTLPDACFCAGSEGGDFMELPCGHGGPTTEPMHVKCIISSFNPAERRNPQPPRCPMCRGAVDKNTLQGLVEYIRQGTVVSFPGEGDREQTTSIYKDLEGGLKLADTLARAQRLADGGDAIQPTTEEQRAGYWTGEWKKINQRMQDLKRDLEEQSQTQEDFDHKQRELDGLKGHLVELTGRATLFENRSSVFRERNGRLLYRNFRKNLTSLGRIISRVEGTLFVKKSVDPLVEQVAEINKAIEEGKLTFEEIDQKEAELAELKESLESLNETAKSLYDMLPEPLKNGLELLERTTEAFHEEKLAIRRYQEEGRDGAKAIWSGYDTEPLTKPSACTVCSGDKGGEFIALDCGHGAPGHGPLHVRCVLGGVVTSVENKTAACCPTCQGPVGAGTLARLAERVGENPWVKYPGEDGTEKRQHPVVSVGEKMSLIDALVSAENIRAGRSPGDELLPRAEEFEDTYYNHMIDEAKQLIERMTAHVSDQTYTQDQLEADRFQLSRLEDRLRVAAGRAVMHEGGSEGWHRSDSMSFKNVYDRLHTVLYRVSVADLDMRHEQEMIKRREEGRAGHPQRVWNGFDTEPLTKPRDCIMCFGEYGGEFMSLDCGHGHSGNAPLHVRCLLDVASNAAKAGTEAHCPVCSASFSEEALSRLADCVERNREVRFPNDAGEPETTRLFDESDEQQREKSKMIDRLVNLQVTRSGHDYEPSDEAYDDTYEHLTQEVEDLARQVMSAIEEHTYTREELEEKQREVEELDHRAAVAAGHAAQVTDWDSDPPFEEKYQRLLEARERLEDAARRMRQEKEDMEHREEEGAGHLHPA